jgi:hypothetical protein
MANRPPGYPRPGAQGGGPGPGPGGAEGPGGYAAGGPLGGGGAGGADAAPDFSDPYKAVNSFLNALKAKDPERLAEAVALRAGTPEETSANYQKIFVAILEQGLAPEDIDELAKKFEGMQIVGRNEFKSSGRLGVIVGKTGTQQKGDYFTRTITVRKEKSGWKVCDVSGQREFERPIMIRGMPGTRGGRGTGGRR